MLAIQLTSQNSSFVFQMKTIKDKEDLGMNIIRNGTGKPWLTDEEIKAGIPSTKDGYRAERRLYKIIQEELPASWTVLYDRFYPGEGGAQIDFLVIVPGKGIVNVDAKGNNYKVVEGNVYLGGDPRNKDVFVEATRGARVVSKYIKEKITDGCDWGAWAHLVVFTEESFDVPLSGAYIQNPELSESGKLAEKIESVLSEFNYFFAAFKYYQDKILSVLLATADQVTTPLDFLGMEKYSIGSLDSDQQAVCYAMGIGKCLHVMGGAGTGKTLIAIACGKELALQGKRVLYVCFNTALADYYRRDISRTKDQNLKKNIVIANFHKLGNVLMGRNYTQTVNGQFNRELTDAKMKECLIKDYFKSKGVKFDVLLVDESQDLTIENISLLLGLAKKDRQIAVFSDARQTIFTKDWELDAKIFGENAEVVEYQLMKNYRNTDKIFEYFKPLSQEKTFPVIRSGVQFTTKDVTTVTMAGMLPMIERMLQEGRNRREIAVLAADKKLLEGIGKVVDRDGINVYFRPDISKWLSREYILATTVQAFKGLEAEIVFYIKGSTDTKEVQYVAESRAKYELYIVE